MGKRGDILSSVVKWALPKLAKEGRAHTMDRNGM